MDLGFQNLILMLASYSNPVQTLQHARAQGYALTDFLVTPLPFGTYSSEPKVILPPLLAVGSSSTCGQQHAWCSCERELACLHAEGGIRAQVKDWIAQMKREGRAFYTSSFYLLAGVLLQKRTDTQPAATDMTDGLLSLMTALK
jgi:hypothetical protein